MLVITLKIYQVAVLDNEIYTVGDITQDGIIESFNYDDCNDLLFVNFDIYSVKADTLKKI